MTDPQSVPVLTDLTAFEQQLARAARHGELLERSGVSVEDLAETDDPDRRIRAELIRELLLGRHGPLDPRGVQVSGARIVGHLDLDWVRAITGLSLVACALPERVTARNTHLPYLSLATSQLSILHADNVRTDGNLILRGAIVHGSGEGGAIRLLGAHIGGQANFTDAEVSNDSGPALHAYGLHTESDLILRQAIVRGSGEGGAIRLPNAVIGGQVSFTNAEVSNDSGPALHADGLHTDSDLILRRAIVRGSGAAGAIRLISADIGDQASFTGAEVSNDSGPALQADGLHTDGDLILEGTIVRGSSEGAALRLVGARIGGQLTISGTVVNSQSGPLISLFEAHVDNTVLLPVNAICTEFDRCTQRDRTITLNRFSFTDLRSVDWRQWLHLVRHHTPSYRPFPYQQLAGIERAAGHDNNARHILIAQQDDLRRRTPEALGGRVAQARHWAWGWLGRYGYRASRLLIALAATLFLSGAVGWIAGQVDTRPGHHAAERVPLTDTAGTACSTVELIGLGIDRGLPLGVTGLRARCDLDTTTRRGETFTVVIWLIQAAVWALATLAIASYTGLIRKPS